jgi:hypothetical protein
MSDMLRARSSSMVVLSEALLGKWVYLGVVDKEGQQHGWQVAFF